MLNLIRLYLAKKRFIHNPNIKKLPFPKKTTYISYVNNNSYSCGEWKFKKKRKSESGSGSVALRNNHFKIITIYIGKVRCYLS